MYKRQEREEIIYTDMLLFDPLFRRNRFKKISRVNRGLVICLFILGSKILKFNSYTRAELPKCTKINLDACIQPPFPSHPLIID